MTMVNQPNMTTSMATSVVRFKTAHRSMSGANRKARPWTPVSSGFDVWQTIPASDAGSRSTRGKAICRLQSQCHGLLVRLARARRPSKASGLNFTSLLEEMSRNCREEPRPRNAFGSNWLSSLCDRSNSTRWGNPAKASAGTTVMWLKSRYTRLVSLGISWGISASCRLLHRTVFPPPLLSVQ